MLFRSGGGWDELATAGGTTKQEATTAIGFAEGVFDRSFFFVRRRRGFFRKEGSGGVDGVGSKGRR